MTSKSKSKRERLFSVYAENLSIYHPHVTDKFLCPLCRTLYCRDALLSKPPELALAHIIPRSFGIGLCTLVCRKCDNMIGTIYDSHLSREKRLRDWGKGGDSLTARMSHGNGDIGVNTRIIDGGKGLELEFVKDISNPADVDHFVEVAEKDWANIKFSIKIKAYNKEKRDCSILYSAFLMMFYIFGYQYVLAEDSEVVRNVLVGNDHIGNLNNTIFSLEKITSEFPLAIPSVSIVVEPRELCSFLVVLPSPQKDEEARCVLMPGFDDNGKDAYTRLLSTSEAFKFDANLVKLNYRKAESYLKLPEFKWAGWKLWRNFTKENSEATSPG